jgi:hypothetical protein
MQQAIWADSPGPALRVVNRTILDMIIYGRPDQADAARRLS